MNGNINTYWIQDTLEPDVWQQFGEATVLALYNMGVLDFVETERKQFSDSLMLAAHRYKKAD